MVTFVTDQPDQARNLIEVSGPGFKTIETDGQNLNILCHRKDIPQINKLLVENNILVESIRVENNLEHYFLSLT